VQQHRLAIHAAVVASQGPNHWTGEWLEWALIGTDDNRAAATGSGKHKTQAAMLPTIEHRSNQPEPDSVIGGRRTNGLQNAPSGAIRHNGDAAAESVAMRSAPRAVQRRDRSQCGPDLSRNLTG
jgi:hypothetical protein